MDTLIAFSVPAVFILLLYAIHRGHSISVGFQVGPRNKRRR